MRPPNSSAASVMTIGAASIAPITSAAVAGARVDQDRADRMGELAGLAATLDVTPMRRCRQRRHVDRSTISPARSAHSSAPTTKSSIATVRAPALLRSVNFAPSADSAETQSAAGSAWLSDAAHRAAVAHRAIGDVGGDALHRAARDIGRASVLDIGMGDAGAEHEFVAATLGLLEFGKRR